MDYFAIDDRQPCPLFIPPLSTTGQEWAQDSATHSPCPAFRVSTETKVNPRWSSSPNPAFLETIVENLSPSRKRVQIKSALLWKFTKIDMKDEVMEQRSLPKCLRAGHLNFNPIREAISRSPHGPLQVANIVVCPSNISTPYFSRQRFIRNS